jgi:hypothetical protein
VEYAIQYEHLKDELVSDSKTEFHFNKVKDNANKYRLDLSDEEFDYFLKLQKSDKDVAWIMRLMSVYKVSFTDALISYITY